MKTTDILNTKRADDYSEIEIFRLLEKSKSLPEASYNSVVLSEIKSSHLVDSAEEGMKLIRALSTYAGDNNEIE